VAIVPYAFASPPGLAAPFDSRMCYAPWSVFQDGSDMDPKQAMPQTVGAQTGPPTPRRARGISSGRRAPTPFRYRRAGGEETWETGPGRTACISPQRRTSHGHRAVPPSLATATQRVATSYYGSECIHTAPGRHKSNPTGRGPGDATTAPKGGRAPARTLDLRGDGRPGKAGETERRRSEFRTTSVFTSPVSRTLELSLQSSFHLSLTVLVRYRSRGHI